MILIESGARNANSFDAKVYFARQLASLDYLVIVDETTAPEQMNRTQKYDSVQFLGKTDDCNIERVLIIGAETISDNLLRTLRGENLDKNSRVTAIGRYASQQSLISAQSKLAYSLGFEPEILDLTQLQPKPIMANSISPIFASKVTPVAKKVAKPNLFLLVPEAMLAKDQTLAILGAISNIREFRCSVVTSAKGKNLIAKSRQLALPTYGYSELCPSTFAKMADIAIRSPGTLGPR